MSLGFTLWNLRVFKAHAHQANGSFSFLGTSTECNFFRFLICFQNQNKLDSGQRKFLKNFFFFFFEFLILTISSKVNLKWESKSRRNSGLCFGIFAYPIELRRQHNSTLREIRTSWACPNRFGKALEGVQEGVKKLILIRNRSCGCSRKYSHNSFPVPLMTWRHHLSMRH